MTKVSIIVKGKGTEHDLRIHRRLPRGPDVQAQADTHVAISVSACPKPFSTSSCNKPSDAQDPGGSCSLLFPGREACARSSSHPSHTAEPTNWPIGDWPVTHARLPQGLLWDTYSEPERASEPATQSCSYSDRIRLVCINLDSLKKKLKPKINKSKMQAVKFYIQYNVIHEKNFNTYNDSIYYAWIVICAIKLHTIHIDHSQITQMVKNPAAMRETWVQSLGWKDPLEKGKATHSSILVWRIPWTEEPGGLQSMGSQRLGHGWATKHSTYTDHMSNQWQWPPPGKQGGKWK